MAKNKKVPKTAKRRLFILAPIATFIICYFIFTLVTTVINIYSLNKEEKELQNKLTELKSDATSLKTEITKLQDKDYVARYARENYLYTKDGEYVIKIDKSKEKATTTKKVNENQKYIYYGCGAGAILIILFIIVKHRKNKRRN